MTPAVLPQALRDSLQIVVNEQENHIFVPVYLKTGAEESEVVDDIVRQLRMIADAINSAAKA